MSSTLRTDPCGDAAAYALGALEPGEAQAFALHLKSCVVCRYELTAFENVVEALPISAPRFPVSRRLRRRVLAGVGSGARVPKPERRPTGARGRALPRTVLAFGAAATLACGALAVALTQTAGRAPTTRTLAAQVLGTPGAAQLRVHDDHGELVVHGLPQPRRGDIYEVWLQRAGSAADAAPQSTTALFSVTHRGDGAVDVPGSLRAVSRVMVTEEPAGGSKVPTSAPIIVATVT